MATFESVFWLVVAAACCLAQPEYTTPGGILTTNCMKGCTEIVVHESNCYPPCDLHRYERCVLVPRHPEPTCEVGGVGGSKTSAALQEQRRAYACRCHPCLFRSHTGMCVPLCPTQGEVEA